MSEENICKCLNCESILIDENPQDDNKTELKGNEKNMVQVTDPTDGDIFWACPICKTDAYIADI